MLLYRAVLVRSCCSRLASLQAPTRQRRQKAASTSPDSASQPAVQSSAAAAPGDWLQASQPGLAGPPGLTDGRTERSAHAPVSSGKRSGRQRQPRSDRSAPDAAAGGSDPGEQPGGDWLMAEAAGSVSQQADPASLTPPPAGDRRSHSKPSGGDWLVAEQQSSGAGQPAAGGRHQEAAQQSSSLAQRGMAVETAQPGRGDGMHALASEASSGRRSRQPKAAHDRTPSPLQPAPAPAGQQLQGAQRPDHRLALCTSPFMPGADQLTQLARWMQ